MKITVILENILKLLFKIDKPKDKQIKHKCKPELKYSDKLQSQD